MDTLQIIAQFGFPIAAACGVAAYVVKINKDHRTDVKEITTENNKKIEELTKVVQNNTIVMTRICERLGMHDEEIEH